MKTDTTFARKFRLLAEKPTIGGLIELCENNFSLLLKLAPGLHDLEGDRLSKVHGSAPLVLQVLENTPYTTLVRLTYRFEQGDVTDVEPDVRLRVYHDARQAEVISLRQAVLPLSQLYVAPGLLQKWRANQFVNRWLQFCLLQGHAFGGEGVGSATPKRSADAVTA